MCEEPGLQREVGFFYEGTTSEPRRKEEDITMVTLKDQLVKLGVVSEEVAQSNSRDHDQFEERPQPKERKQNKHKSNKGAHDGPPRERGERQGGRDGQQKHRQNHRQNPVAHLTPEQRAEEADALIERARVPMPHRGHKRYYFQFPSGELDFIEIDHSGYQALTGGVICAVFNRRGHVCMIDGRALHDLWHLAPELIPTFL